MHYSTHTIVICQVKADIDVNVVIFDQSGDQNWLVSDRLTVITHLCVYVFMTNLFVTSIVNHLFIFY